MVETVDVLVVGGGIIGAACAARLAREGKSVLLAERAEIGSGSSYAAGGLLTPVHPWNYPEPLLELDEQSLALWRGPLCPYFHERFKGRGKSKIDAQGRPEYKSKQQNFHREPGVCQGGAIHQ